MIKGIGLDIVAYNNNRTVISGFLDTLISIRIVTMKDFNHVMRVLNTDFNVDMIDALHGYKGWIIVDKGEVRLVKNNPDLIEYSAEEWVKEYNYLKAKYRHVSLMENRKPNKKRNGGATYLYQAHDITTGYESEWHTALGLADVLRCSHHMVYKGFLNNHYIEGRYSIRRKAKNGNR